MDDAFKFKIIFNGFTKSIFYSCDWTRQVVNINRYWDEMLDSFDRDEFKEYIQSECTQTEPYNLELAFINAATEWRIELMTSVANKIAQFNTDNIPDGTQLVRWNPKTRRMDFLFELCFI